MQVLFVLVVSLALTFGAPGQRGINEDHYIRYMPQVGGRIVGGVVATIEEIPYQVAVLRNNALFCGGSLIAPKIVLTAAHCVADNVIYDISMLSVRAGTARNDSGGDVFPASKLVIHEDHVSCFACTAVFDVAAIFLTESAVGAGGVASVIPLASVVPPSGTFGVISGWGDTSEWGWGSSRLMRADVPVYDQVECHNSYGSAIDDTVLCAGFENGGTDACQGDSGGPYAINGKLVGIVSWGAGCARPKYPGVYASVPAFREWIRTHTGV